jgi:hypothetical protein
VYTYHYNVSDAAGNAADEVTRTVTVLEEEVPDTVKPVITLIGEASVSLALGAEYADAGATAADDRDGDVTGAIVVSIMLDGNVVAEVDTSMPGVYTYHYNVSDTAGNAADEVTRTVTVLDEGVPGPDTVKPVITLIGEASVSLALGAEYADAGAAAADDRDGDLSSAIVTTITLGGSVVPEVDTGVPGVYTYHYNVSDAAGNAADEVTRSVTVKEEDQPVSSAPSPEPTPAPTTPAPTTPPAPAPAATPSPAPTSAPLPAGTQVLASGELGTAVNGTITVQVAEGKDTLLLPANIAGLVGNNTLRLAFNDMTVEIPQEMLQGIQGAAAGALAEVSQIRFSAKSAPADAMNRLVNNAAVNGSVDLSVASGVYDFSLEVVLKDGTAIPVSSLAKPLTLTFKVLSNVNTNLLGIYFIAGDGTLQYVGGTLSDGIMAAEISHFSRYAVLEYRKNFADVAADSWASSVIQSMAAKHIIQGITDKAFNPQGQVTRAEFAAMITRALGLTAAGSAADFADVSADAWYAEAVAAASQAGIVLGRTADSFAPDRSITREEMAVMIVRAYEYTTGSQAVPAGTGIGAFTDSPQIHDWAREAAVFARESGLINGRGSGQFAPQAQMTRAESVQVLSNLLSAL